MTERCQTMFTENIDSHKYIIYIGIICTSIAILYLYRFHFTIVAFSYGLGCLVSYYGLKSNILLIYVDKLRCHFVGDTTNNEVKEAPRKGCVTCGSKDCNRHDSASTEPWAGLQIHKQLDQAIEDFYNTILDQFINSWYSKITLHPFFVDELRHQIRYASACLLQRAVKIDYSRLITERLVPCGLRHYVVCAGAEPCQAPLDTKLALHPAAASRAAELKYLRSLTNAIMPYLMKNHDLNNPVFSILIREIFAGWVLLSLTDVLADPYILNTLIILATGDETMAELPTTPNYEVEFLETFVRQTDSVYLQRGKLLRVDLDVVMNDQDYFYAFMQYMKSTSHIHLLQFYKDIKSFQTKILNPDLNAAEKAHLHKEACDIHALYLSGDSLGRVPLEAALADELYVILQSDDSIRRLQTSRALYQAARQSHAVLEKIMLPKFLHSEEFYSLLIGSRTPTGYQKQMTKRPQDKQNSNSLKLGTKLKAALKSQSIDGQVLECLSNDDSEGDGVDNMDILKYLDSVATEESLSGQDLSTYKVVLTGVETKLQASPRRGTVRVFALCVHRAEPRGGARLRTVRRSEHDFHLLRSKLHEFHGDALLAGLPLPSRRDNSPMETLRYKYEDFLQRLLQKSLLQTSELLRIFLTEESDFALVVQASTLNANSADLANIYQSVTHKLRKEKGQHLESFLRNLLVSSDMERYQALKHGTARDVEEAQEVSEEVRVEEFQVARVKRARDYCSTIFLNNFDTEPVVFELRDRSYQTSVVGFTHCFMYLLMKVVKAYGLVSAVIGSLLAVTRHLADDVFNKYLNATLRTLLSQRRLAHLIRLGHGLLFDKKSSPPNREKQRELARTQLLRAFPPSAALRAAFRVVQAPRHNKQLVYNLLDLCVAELFPELTAADPMNGPNS